MQTTNINLKNNIIEENFEENINNPDSLNNKNIEDQDEIEEETKKEKSGLKDFDVVAVMDMYNSGDNELKQKAVEMIILQLDGFIRSVINKKYSTYAYLHGEDMISSAHIAILTDLPKYDPKKGALTTFFYLPIVHALQEYLDLMVNHTTTHYSTNLNKIQKVINRLESENKPWNIQILRNETGLREETIKRCLNIMQYKNEAYYETEDFLNSQVCGISESPEDIFLEKERDEALYESLMKLDKEERIAMTLFYGVGKTSKMSYKNTAQCLGLKVDEVKRHIKHGQSKLQGDKKLSSIYRSNLINHINKNLIPLNSSNEAELILEKVDSVSEFDFEENADGQLELFFSV